MLNQFTKKTVFTVKMYLPFLFLIFLVKVKGGERQVVISVQNCTQIGDEGHINSIDIYPSTKVKIGKNFTISGQGYNTLNRDITQAYYNATTTWLGNIIYKISGNACIPYIFNLPLDVGKIWFNGVNCPVKASSSLTVDGTAQVHTDAPDATIKTVLTATDSISRLQIMCIDITIDIGVF